MTTASTDPKQTHKDHIPEGPHETMGQYLQRARIEQEKTLDSVAEATCIHIATIKALEEDDYDKLPAEVFVRGFIKIYATLLHLDTDKALSLYQPAPVPDSEEFPERKSARRKPILPGETLAEASPFTAGRQFLILLLLVVIAFFTYKAFLSGPKPESSREITTTTDKTTIGEPNQQALPIEPAVMHPEGDDASSSIPEPEKDKNNMAEVPVATTPPANDHPLTAEPVATSPTVTPEETIQPQNDELSAVTTPAARQERLVIEPHRKKTVRKAQQAATTNENGLAAEDREAVPPSTPPAESVAKPTSPLLNTTAAGADSATETATKTTTFVYILKASFTDLTWLEVIVDSGPQRDYTFRAGEQWEWRANKEIQLHIGNAGGVNLRLNNKPLPSLGETGKSVRVTLPTEPR